MGGATWAIRQRFALAESCCNHRCVGGLRQNHLDLGPLPGENTTDTLERAAGSETRNPIVQPLSSEIVDDLSRRRARVVVGVCFVLELPRQEPPVLSCELVDFPYHAGSAFRCRREDDFRAEEAHQPASLNAE